MSGVLKQNKGHITIEGLDNIKDRSEINKMLGICPQQNIIYKNLTVYEMLLFIGKSKSKIAMGDLDRQIDQMLK